ncbi:MAG: bifunctional diaminohydroxyphosphoribosylaminopyrimidine deaminase/5-amino-6-(5-phosphoribosylamino)uracil reductase RibD [Candidatus Acidiferrales bacterium]
MSTRSSTEPILDHGYWMTEAIELARDAMALAHPNPRVGAVVVKDGILVGRGFHAFDRLDHAEIVALDQAGPKAAGASLYVNLEPCSHTGRTGPCTKAIIAAGVKKVYAAMKDPNPLVSGRGFAELRHAGIEVHIGIYEPYAKETNEDFAKWIRTQLPFVTLKAALTLDGQIAQRAGRTTAISGPASRQLVQHLRHRADALLTGIGTILADDPLLTDRSKKPRRRRLLRAVVDSRLRLPLRSQLVRSARHDVLVFTTRSVESPKARALARAGVEVFRAPGRAGRVDLREVIRELGRRQMLNVLLEAGAALNGSALEAGLVDKLVLFYAPRIMGAGGVPLAQVPSRWFAKSPPLSNVTLERCEPDFVVEGYFHDVYRDHRRRGKN